MLLLLFTTLHAGDRWDYLMRTHSDITWNQRNKIYLTEICEKISKKHQLIVHMADETMQPFDKCKWAYSFISMEKLEPDQAVDLLKRVFNDILTEIHRNRQTVVYLTEDVDAKTFSPALIGLKISFLNKDSKRIESPHVARVYISEGHILYNVSVDNQLQNPIALF